MATVSHARKLTKKSGGKKTTMRDRKKYEMGSGPTKTTIGAAKKKLDRGFGGNIKGRLMRAETANVLDPKSNKYSVVKIITEKENPADRNFARMNIVTKGAVIQTELGLARVTSRPGQDGVVNAVLLGKQ